MVFDVAVRFNHMKKFSTGPSPQQMDEDAFLADSAYSPVDEAAALWVTRLTSGEVSAETRAAFAQWRAADPAHDAALRRFRGLWTQLERALPVPVVHPQATTVPARTERRRGPRRAWQRWAIAASLIVATVVGYQAGTQWRYDEVTAQGERRNVVLADGSTVMLSGDTALNLQLDGNARHVQLARGEAWFDVTHDAQRPFVVDAAGNRVHVLGTRFSVRRQGDAVQVVVEQGRVDGRGADGSHALLTADQRVDVSAGAVSAVATVDAHRALAWREGRLYVSDLPLADIARLIEPHVSQTVIGDAARARRFSAADLARVDAWFDALGEAESMQVDRLGPVILIR